MEYIFIVSFWLNHKEYARSHASSATHTVKELTLEQCNTLKREYPVPGEPWKSYRRCVKIK